MNVHLFNMARIIDDSKLIAIKNKLVELTVKQGYENTSIAKIAQEAGVSVGYLYRHYDSKESLLLSIYVEIFNNLNDILLKTIESKKTFSDFIFDFYIEILKISQKNENNLLFLLKLMSDYSVKISNETKQNLISSINLLKEKFSDDINKEIDDEQLFIQVLGTFLLSINLRKRGVLNNQQITKKDIKLISQITVNSLK